MKISGKRAGAAGFLISFIFLYLALRNVEWGQVMELLAGTRYIYLIPAALISLADFALRAYRWKLLISPVKSCGYINLMSSMFIGFFANTVLPMRAGELIRAFHIGTREKISKISSLATIAVERVLDGFTVLGALFLTVFIFPFEHSVRIVLTTGLIFFSACAVFFYCLIIFREKTLKITCGILSFFPEKLRSGGERMIDSFISGLAGVRARHIIPAAILSVVSWSLNALAFFTVARAMGLDMSYAGAVFVMALTALGIAIPSSPGYIGVFEYFGILAAVTVGISRNDAAGYILLCRVFQTILILSAGGFFLTRENLSIYKLKKKATEDQ